jgi:kumamolisin
MQKHPLQGSERKPMAGARLVGPADPNERLEVTVLLRRAAAAMLAARVARLNQGGFALAPMTREAFGAVHGASQKDIEAVKNFAAAHLLAVVAASAERATVILSGTVAQFSEAFGVTLNQYEHKAGRYRGREGTVRLPAELRDCVQAVLGLDNRPQARTKLRPRDGAAPAALSYAPTTVASLYGFPAGTGAGQTIGIIELAGGTRTPDLNAYFSSLGIAPPTIVSVSVDHGQNQATGDANGPDGEVMLDVEVAGAIAPSANFAVYFAPNTDAGFLNAVTTAIHDATNKPSIISISWGGPEASWTAQAMDGFDQAFQDAAAMGITVCVASGDNGSSDGVADGSNNVDFPASSPHVLACGGTSLQSSRGAISSETVWNDGANGGATGGGMSAHFEVPAWQSGLAAPLAAGGQKSLTGRGVPDVAGCADPETGYQVRVDGQNTVIGGTSAVAPLWAGLLARLNAAKGSPVGFINPVLYQNAAALNDIVSGNNGTFSAGPGWDACTGLGSPNGAALAALLGQAGAAPIAAQPDAFMVKGNDMTKGSGKIKDKAFMVKGNDAPAAEPDAFMVKGNDAPAASPNAFMVKGNDVPAAEPDAFMVKGNAEKAKAGAKKGKAAHVTDKSFQVRGD